jgi:UMF1 family MFS transporter
LTKLNGIKGLIPFKKPKDISILNQNNNTTASKRELWAWAMYDFANSGFTTVVLTTIYNVYFVSVIASQQTVAATLIWTAAIAVANGLVLLSAPTIGAVADQHAWKKRFLTITTIGCIAGTALLATITEQQLALAVALIVLTTVMFCSGENLIAAFLPELCEREYMGRLSGYAWGLGYFGGIVGLAACLLYISHAEAKGHAATDYVPVTLYIVAALFAISATPTFLFLKERAVASTKPSAITSTFVTAWRNSLATLNNAKQFPDFFRFLWCIVFYQSGIATVVVVAAVYANQVIGLNQKEIILMVLVVNVTAAIGAIGFGILQDYAGSVKTLFVTLLLWMVAVILVYLTESVADIWAAANVIGIAMGASQSAGRALIGQFTPPAQTAEFFGLWGLATKLSAIIGPLSYGAINYLSGGSHQTALLSTLVFFIAGAVLLITVDEQRGHQAVINRN